MYVPYHKITSLVLLCWIIGGNNFFKKEMTMTTTDNVMDFPHSLHSILSDFDVKTCRFSNKNDDDDWLERLQSLNEEMEASFGKQTTQVDDCELLFDSLKDCINLLHYTLLTYIFYGMKNNEDGHGNNCQVEENLKSSLESTNDDDDDDVINQVSVHVSDALIIKATKKMERSTIDSSIIDTKFWVGLSELLRTCKNSIRWKRQVWMHVIRYKRSSSASMKSPISRLQNVGMIELYLNLMTVNGDDSYGVARNASLVLFHATFGQTEADSSQARTKLVQYGLPILMRLLDDDEQQSAPFMLSIVRHVHNLISTTEYIIPKMNQHLLQSKNEGEDGTKNLFTVLVSKLSQVLKSEHPTKFPGLDDDINDRRSDLFIEIIRVLFVISNRGKESVQELELKNKESMKELGFVLADTLLLSWDETKKITNLHVNKKYQCQLAAVQLLMDSPPEYGQFLVQKKAMDPLLFIFSNQLTRVIDNGRNHGLAHGTQQDAALILPILVVLNRLSASNPTIVNSIRDLVFPPECEEAFLAKVKEEKALVSSGGGPGAKNMKPIDAPKDTVRWKLIKLMTWPETSVKRCTGELLWTICNGNATEFVLRLGFGNAVHFLSIKGLVKIPEQSTVVTNNN